ANSGQYRREYGTFLEGVRENAPRIEMPDVAEFDKLRAQAQAGGTAFTAASLGAVGRARLRIEFVAVDLNDDGDTQDADEGFIRVYQSSDADWVVGAGPVDDLRNSRNCGHLESDGTFRSARDHPSNGSDNKVDAVTEGPGRR